MRNDVHGSSGALVAAFDAIAGDARAAVVECAADDCARPCNFGESLLRPGGNVVTDECTGVNAE